MSVPAATRIRATTLTPFHYHSLAVPSGTATLAPYLADRAMSYALASAMGALAASPALPEKDYPRDFRALPWLASIFEAREPRLMRPLGKRLNLDGEGGYRKRIQDATGTGNLKTWFFVQEVPPGTVYDGAVFGLDPFALAGRVENRDVGRIVVRAGRHLGGILALDRRESGDDDMVRLNAWTANLAGYDVDDDPLMSVDVYALHDIQITAPMPLNAAAERVGAWRASGPRTKEP